MDGRRLVVLLVTIGVSACCWTSPAKADHTFCRAGCPQQVACYARPADTPPYIGYYVGGGSAVGGTHRCCDEGTWGWDYHGCWLPHRVILYWSHWRYQGGIGAYAIEGPPVPNVPTCAAAVVTKPFHKCARDD